MKVSVQQAEFQLTSKGVMLYLHHDKGLTIYRLDPDTAVLLPNDETSVGALRDLMKEMA